MGKLCQNTQARVQNDQFLEEKGMCKNINTELGGDGAHL